MSSMGELTFFLGLQVKKKYDGIFISQDKYVSEILKKFGFSSIRTANTLMETNKALAKDEEGEDVDVHLYRSMIGSLMYLTSSIPDIMFSVCACSRFQVQPKLSHMFAVKRIFRYLKCRPELGLWYPKDSPFILEAFPDSEYSRCSVTGKSTQETKIHVDNESAICVIKNPVYHSKTKHIKIRHHFIRDSYKKRLIEMIKIHTYLNVADLLTKACDVSRFNFLVASIGKKGRDTKIPQSGGPLIKFGDEAVHKELGDRMERAATTVLALKQNRTVRTATARTSANGEVELTTTTNGQVKTITKASLRRHLKLEDNGGVTTLPNSDIFEQLALMGAPETSPSRITSSPSLSPQTHTPVSTPSTSQPPNTQPIPDAEEAVLMPHESPLHSVHSLGRDKGSLSLNELMDLCTSLSKKVEGLESELKQTKKTYSTAITKLIFRVKKLEQKVKTTKVRRRARIVLSEDEEDVEDSSKHGRKISAIDKDPTISLVQPEQEMEHDVEEEPTELVEDQGSGEKGEKEVSTVRAEYSTVILEVSIAAANLVYIRRSAQKREDKGKAIMQESEPPKKVKKRVQVQMSMDEDLAKKVFEEEQAKAMAEQEQERINFEAALELQKQLDEREEVAAEPTQA
ncbi:hypothetical protein Tco_0104518 [Tanacetum coccineum]